MHAKGEFLLPNSPQMANLQTTAFSRGYTLTPLRGFQNSSFSANWSCRELVAVFVMAPADSL